MRMVHSLLTDGRGGEALAHARRALETAGEARPDLRVIALIALVAYGAVQTTGANVNAIFGSISNQLAAAGA